MNRVLSVSLVFSLASILACAPGSRRQTGVAAKNLKAAPTPVPVNSTPSVEPAKFNTSNNQGASLPTTKLDMSSFTLNNAEVLYNDKKALNLSFSVTDATKAGSHEASFIIDGSSKTVVNDTNFSNISYVCGDGPNVAPADCSNTTITFTYSGVAASAKVVRADNLPVFEGIRDMSVKATPADKKGQSFGTAQTQKLDFTLGDKTFSRINAEVVAAGTTPDGHPQDKELSTDGTNIAIEVYGLPTVDLDKKPISLPTTLDGKNGRAALSTEKMLRQNGTILRYSILLASDGRTLLLGFPLGVAPVSPDEDSGGDAVATPLAADHVSALSAAKGSPVAQVKGNVPPAPDSVPAPIPSQSSSMSSVLVPPPANTSISAAPSSAPKAAKAKSAAPVVASKTKTPDQQTVTQQTTESTPWLVPAPTDAQIAEANKNSSVTKALESFWNYIK